jgi:hypothetical protein
MGDMQHAQTDMNLIQTFIRNPERKIRLHRRMTFILEWILSKLGSSGPVYGPVTGSNEYGNEHRECLDQLWEYRLLEDHAR